MDDGKGGDFVSLIGYLTPFLKLFHTVSSNIERGVVYRFRYRAKNIVGWSDYSDIAFILAASIPTKPPSPKFILSSSTTIAMSLA
jgi:hypothetical protein